MSNITDAGTLAYNLEAATPYATHPTFVALGQRLQVAVESARYSISEGDLYGVGRSVLQAAQDLQEHGEEGSSLEYNLGAIVAAVFPNLVEMADAVEMARVEQARKAAARHQEDMDAIASGKARVVR